MAQHQRPVTDIDATGWQTAPLWDKLDETSASDADFVQSSVNGSVDFNVSLSSATDPTASTGHILHTRLRKSNTSARVLNFTVELLETATVRATFTHNGLTNTWTQFDDALSGAEADAIAALDQRAASLAGTGGGGRRGGGNVSFSKLNGDFTALLELLQGADATPTTQAVAACTEAQRALTELLTQWNEIKNK